MKILIVASGPSVKNLDLTPYYREMDLIIGVNNSYKLIPPNSILFAGDYAWWKENINKIPKELYKITSSNKANKEFGICDPRVKYVPGGFSSGGRAIELAEYLGASEIHLLGFDCDLSNGTHWHGDHVDTLRNPVETAIPKWVSHFSKIKDKSNIPIYNRSKCSKLSIFEYKG